MTFSKRDSMVERAAEPMVRTLAREFRVLGVTGPRQSGKTTLVRSAFPEMPYVNLEDLSLRSFAREDPKAFLAQYADGAILDEAQHCPELFSYLQVDVDEDGRKGKWVLTGSQHFAMLRSVSQTLAGRVGYLNLRPFDLAEARQAETLGGRPVGSLEELLFAGLHPEVRQGGVDPGRWAANYITTYLERDLQQILRIIELDAFRRFLLLCAGHVGQQINLREFGAAVGVTHPTIRAWFDVLRTSFQIVLLQPFHRNFGKRLRQAPRLYFGDTGIACHLLGLSSPEQLLRHPARGGLFENWVLLEFLKSRAARALPDNAYFWRTHDGVEVDLVFDHGPTCLPIECKSGMTIAGDWTDSLGKFCQWAGPVAEEPLAIYGGKEIRRTSSVTFVPWQEITKWTSSAGGG
jgi:predicted AAA+ superfamily ATPase